MDFCEHKTPICIIFPKSYRETLDGIRKRGVISREDPHRPLTNPGFGVILELKIFEPKPPVAERQSATR
jgi:hypothetical protein